MPSSSLYVAMTKVSESMRAQAVRVNNLANGSTPGFRAALAGERSMPLYGDGFPSTVFVGAETSGYDFSPGMIQHTNNSLDVAINGSGWIAVQGEDGVEGYTRRGDLRIDNGMLVNGAGQQILGDSGPIYIPPAKEINIAEDGSVKVMPLTGGTTTIVAGKIKLVNPDSKMLVKKEDGLFVKNDATLAEIDPSVKVEAGGFELSNVKSVSEMIDIIDSARMLEMALKITEQYEENAKTSEQLLQVSAH